MSDHVRHIDLSYDSTNSDESALKLVTALFPEWAKSPDTIEFIRFKDGITNTLMKAINKKPGLSEEEIDSDSVLLRAYGNGTHVLIDRNRECTSHSLLANHKLAPPLLARFNNGLLYRFIPGKVCAPSDLRRIDIWRGVAQRIAEWHATLPISAVLNEPSSKEHHSDGTSACSKISHLPSPNIWTVTQGWTDALPETNEAEKKRKLMLQNELQWLINELGDAPGIDNQSLVFGHCDLLSANVIIRPPPPPTPTPTHHDSSPYSSSASSPTTAASTAASELPTAAVSFIDYEYATPCPAVFDIANHFAEWGGFDCDMSVLPTRSQRRDFLTTYLLSYNSFRGREFLEDELDQLMNDVDRFRGAPGFYWGVWALIQATISQIDFDYANYADLRLSEYWAWKESLNEESRASKGEEIPLRERRWAEEE